MTPTPHSQAPRSDPADIVGTAAAGSPAAMDPMDAAHLQERIDARDHRKGGVDPLLQVRASDLEPYTGLGYLSKLFRLIAVLLLVLLVAEVGVGVSSEGTGSLRTLVTEASRLLVIAGVLWGAGDLATLLIDIGHDVRASRILLGRQVAHADDLGLAQASAHERGAARDLGRDREHDVAGPRTSHGAAPGRQDDLRAG